MRAAFLEGARSAAIGLTVCVAAVVLGVLLVGWFPGP